MKTNFQRGQGLVEYTLIVLLVALVFWVGVKNSPTESSLKTAWASVANCLDKPLECGRSTAP